MYCTAPTLTAHALHDHELDAGQYLCDPCVRRVRTWLRSIPATMVVLAASTQRETTGATVRSGSRTAPLPGREDTLNLCGPWAREPVRDEHGDQCGPPPLAAVLHSWVQLLCEEQLLDAPSDVTVVTLAAWLDRHLDRIARQPWAGEMYDELRTAMGRAWAITATAPRTRPVTRPCPRCSELLLTRTDGDLYVRCSGCDGCWTEEELASDAVRRASPQAA